MKKKNPVTPTMFGFFMLDKKYFKSCQYEATTELMHFLRSLHIKQYTCILLIIYNLFQQQEYKR